MAWFPITFQGEATMLFRRTLAAAVMAATMLASALPAAADCDPHKPNLTPMSRYVINGGEVYDKTTNLTWQRCAVGQQWKEGEGCAGPAQQMTWDEAMRQANKPWRVPTKDELWTLVSPACKSPSLNGKAFLDNNFWYWTSTESGAVEAWFVNFTVGYTSYINRTAPFAVRLVRDGR